MNSKQTKSIKNKKVLLPIEWRVKSDFEIYNRMGPTPRRIRKYNK